MGEKEGSLGENTYSKGDSKLSLVNENKETNSEQITPPSTKVWSWEQYIVLEEKTWNNHKNQQIICDKWRKMWTFLYQQFL